MRIDWLFGWEVTSVVVVAGLSLALGFLAMDDFRLAKLMFAVAWIDVSGGLLFWGASTQVSPLARMTVVFLSLGAIGVLADQSWRYVNSKEELKTAKSQLDAPATSVMPTFVTLKSMFESGWPNLPAWYGQSILRPSGNGSSREVLLSWRLNGDFYSRSRFLDFYFDPSTPPKEVVSVCTFLAIGYNELLKSADDRIDVLGKFLGDTAPTHMRDMFFSKRFYLYYDNPDFSLAEKSAIEQAFSQHGLSILFRDQAYVELHRGDTIPRKDPLVPNSFLLPAKPQTGLEITIHNLGKPPTVKQQ